MGFGTAVVTCLRKYAWFEGRARRSEYWWFFLFRILPVLVFGVSVPFWADYYDADREIAHDVLYYVILGYIIFWLLTLLPWLAVLVRRLHDTNASGFWAVLLIVPAGGLILLIWCGFPGSEGENNYGEDPVEENWR